MTVKFYSNDGKSAIEIIPDYNERCVSVDFLDEKGSVLGSVGLNSDEVSDFAKMLNEFNDRVQE
tara:strand:- start:127 stop:318 length:192 start_codon:yes stop_codon:yes gene_type:complete